VTVHLYCVAFDVTEVAVIEKEDEKNKRRNRREEVLIIE
jgi:hypothetical protein